MPARLATAKDYDAYRRLQQATLAEEHATGESTLLPTARTLQFYLDYFLSYTQGSRFGVCVLWSPEAGREPVGFALGGEAVEPPAWDTTLGREAQLWDLYVEAGWRKRGTVLELLELGAGVLRGQGFQTVSYNVPPGGRSRSLALADGAVPRGVWYTVDLRVMRSYEQGGGG